jgi:HlyD family secretion protein
MADLKPIPRPASQYWRDFRFHVAPLLVFAATCVAVVLMWAYNVSPPTFVGQVEPIVAEITSQDAGIITNLFVTRFQTVKKGDPVVEVVSTDVQRFDSSLSVLRGQLTLAQAELNTVISRERLAFEYESLRNEYMRQKIELAASKSQLEPAERDAAIAQGLLSQKILAEIDFDYFSKIVGPLRAKIEETGKYVTELGNRLDLAKHLMASFPSELSEAMMQHSLAEIAKYKAQLENMQMSRIILRAPIDGTVTAVANHVGENVLAGVPILTITSESSERIVGYLRQPFPFEPKEGMKVTVRSRSFGHEAQIAQIVSVGKQFEKITAPLLRPGVAFELGLPIGISVPPNPRPRPSELVDLTLHQ